MSPAMVQTPEESDHTSIKRRIRAAGSLFPFAGNPRNPMPEDIPLPLDGYLELVDWRGRILREDKRGTIDGKLPPILDRLQIDPRHWLYLNKNFESRFKSLVGTAHSVRNSCEQFGKRWAHGVRDCERYFSPPATS